LVLSLIIYLINRFVFLVYCFVSILDSLVITVLYFTQFVCVFKLFDWALPFYFCYTNKFLKGTYIANLKDKHE